MIYDIDIGLGIAPLLLSTSPFGLAQHFVHIFKRIAQRYSSANNIIFNFFFNLITVTQGDNNIKAMGAMFRSEEMA